ncbi:MAG TPA: hypothetical protein DCX03_00400 [Bacteroidales bacterium]|nr:hypothetical protein [Bacteroidales bacterium]
MEIKDLTLKLVLVFSYIYLICYFTIGNTNNNYQIIIMILSFVIIFSILLLQLDRCDSRKFLFVLGYGSILIFLFYALVPIKSDGIHRFQDSLMYFVTAQSIYDTGHLAPTYLEWYNLLDSHMQWPILGILTSSISLVSNLNLMIISQFVCPFLGFLAFIACVMLCKKITNSMRIAILAGMLFSISAIAAWFYSIYHPQGLGVLFYIFIIYSLISLNQKHRIYSVICMFFIAALTFTHPFSSIYTSIVLLSLLLFQIMSQRIPGISQVSPHINIGLIITTIVVILGYNVFVPIVHGSIGLLKMAVTGSPFSLSLETKVSSIQSQNLYNLFIVSESLNKFILLILGILPSVYFLVYGDNSKKVASSLMYINLCTITIGMVILSLPLDRILLFCTPFISIYAAYMLYLLADNDIFQIKKYKIMKFTIGIVIILMLTVGVIGSNTQSCYFGSQSYFGDITAPFPNYFTPTDNEIFVGKWLQTYAIPDAYIGVESYTSAFYYAKWPRSQLDSYTEENPFDYIIIQKNSILNRLDLQRDSQILFDGHNVVLT